MTTPRAPFDGPSRPFTIGMKPIDPSAWIEIGPDLDAMLAEKDRLIADRPGEVFMEDVATRPAQAELLDRLAAHLAADRSSAYVRDGGLMHVLPAGRTVDLRETPPLLAAARLVADDLVLMRRAADGWRLVAAALCFPSSWTLSEKFGRPLDAIHGPVPAFGRGSRAAALIERIFDNLAPGQPAIRWNWSLQSDDALFRPISEKAGARRAAEAAPRFAGGATGAWLRVERQTLLRLPASGDVVFTIRIHLDPLDALARHTEGRAIAATLVAQLAGLDGDQLDYKGFRADRDRLLAGLAAIAG